MATGGTSSTTSSALAELTSLYDAWDEALENERPAFPRTLACPANCSVCCERNPAIPVTAVEARLVADSVALLPDPLRSEIRRRASRISRELGDENRSGAIGLPCPLLENGRCTVYRARPLLCRAYGFAADGGDYFGCEILVEGLRAAGAFRLPSLEAARSRLPEAEILDAEGTAIPALGPLAEQLDRLLS